MHEQNTIKLNLLQDFPHRAGRTAFTALAAARVGFERARQSKTARAIGWAVLAALVLVLTALISFRAAQAQQERRFEEWQERFVNDYLAQQEAARIGIPPDPKEELKKQEITALAQFIQGVKMFNYSFEDFVTAAWCMDARTRNPAYPETLVEVIQQPKQWLGYNPEAIVTKDEYATATRVWDVIRGADHPEVSSDFVYASFERDGITLRDTWEISTKTHFWRYEQ